MPGGRGSKLWHVCLDGNFTRRCTAPADARRTREQLRTALSHRWPLPLPRQGRQIPGAVAAVLRCLCACHCERGLSGSAAGEKQKWPLWRLRRQRWQLSASPGSPGALVAPLLRAELPATTGPRWSPAPQLQPRHAVAPARQHAAPPGAAPPDRCTRGRPRASRGFCWHFFVVAGAGSQ